MDGEQHHHAGGALVRPGDYRQRGQDGPDRCGDGVGSVLAAVLGGPLVDRLGFKGASMLADLVCAATVAGIPLLYLVGVCSSWQLLVLVFALSCINTPGDSARYA